MKALFRSVNLIGDCLNISPALNAWYRKQSSEPDIDLLTLDDGIAYLYNGMGVPLRVVFGRMFREYDFEFNFDCSVSFSIGDQYQCHQAEAYARMLGVEIDSVKPVYTPSVRTHETEQLLESCRDCILLSPFSKSCSSQKGERPNKMLPWHKWKPVLRYLRGFGLQIRVLGGESDRAPELDFSEEEYVCGHRLEDIAWVMRSARLLVGIDNGMGHLAASQECPTFLLYPACLGMHWIVPWGNPHIVPVQMDPATVNPAAILWAAREAVPKLLAVRK